MTIERRKDERVRLPMEMRLEGALGRTARIYDISVSGCYIESLAQVYVGEEVRFEIQLPSGDWLPLQGEVVHFQPTMGFAVRFINLSEEAQKRVVQLIEHARKEK